MSSGDDDENDDDDDDAAGGSYSVSWSAVEGSIAGNRWKVDSHDDDGAAMGGCLLGEVVLCVERGVAVVTSEQYVVPGWKHVAKP